MEPQPQNTREVAGSAVASTPDNRAPMALSMHYCKAAFANTLEVLGCRPERSRLECRPLSERSEVITNQPRTLIRPKSSPTGTTPSGMRAGRILFHLQEEEHF